MADVTVESSDSYTGDADLSSRTTAFVSEVTILIKINSEI